MLFRLSAPSFCHHPLRRVELCRSVFSELRKLNNRKRLFLWSASGRTCTAIALSEKRQDPHKFFFRISIWSSTSPGFYIGLERSGEDHTEFAFVLKSPFAHAMHAVGVHVLLSKRCHRFCIKLMGTSLSTLLEPMLLMWSLAGPRQARWQSIQNLNLNSPNELFAATA